MFEDMYNPDDPVIKKPFVTYGHGTKRAAVSVAAV